MVTTQEKRPGRPRNSDPPRFLADEVERILVFGETVEYQSGVSTIQYPSFASWRNDTPWLTRPCLNSRSGGSVCSVGISFRITFAKQ